MENHEGKRAIALDIGGTKLAAGIVNESGDLLERREIPTPKTQDGEELFRTILALLESFSRDEVVVCGVGSGGPMTRGGEEVSPLNIPAWRDFPLKRRLSEALKLPVFVDNDVKALALGEGWKGAAAEEDNFIAMVVSTGVGGGIVLNGKLLDGASGNAGHIGHIIVEPQGRPCPCGSRGCLESEISGPSIERIIGKPPKEAPLEFRIHAGRLLGRAVAIASAILDIRLAVVGGGVALGFGEPFFRAAQEAYDAYAHLSFMKGLRIIPVALRDRGPLIGAAAVGFRGIGIR
jgi:glucokinase